MTPDRIYIFYDGDERWYDVKEWEGRTPPPANVEYIRKDALLEWLEESKKEMEKELEGSHEAIRFATAIAISSFQEVIDELNSF